MKNAFQISLFLNILLGTTMLYCVRSGRSKEGRNETAVASAAIMGTAIKTSVVPDSPPGAPCASLKEFRWSQLESTDYRTYIANLRGIGCPEQTVRDIITADVDTLYVSRRTELERKQAAPVGGPLHVDIMDRPELEAEWQQLRSEEASMISELLDAQSSAASVARALRLKSQEPVSPIVFQDVDLAALKLYPGQIEAIKNLRLKFQRETAGRNQDPGDPASLQQWQNARRESDSLLLAILGSDGFTDFQMQASRQSQSLR